MPSLEPLWDLLFPAKCPFCGALLEKGALLCPDCQSTLPWLTGEKAFRKVELTEGCWSVLKYEGTVRKAIHGYKFSGKSARSKPFGTLMTQCLKDNGVEFDLVTWPSLSKKRLRQRGYDQAGLLANEIGARLGVPVLSTLPKEDRPAQSGLEGPEARKVNLLGAYTAIEPERFQGKRLLLVDDIVTTGATLSECAGTLRAAGAGAVVCVTLARA